MTILIKGQEFPFFSTLAGYQCADCSFLGKTASRHYAPMGGSEEVRGLLSSLSRGFKSSELILEGENYATSNGRFMGGYKGEFKVIKALSQEEVFEDGATFALRFFK